MARDHIREMQPVQLEKQDIPAKLLYEFKNYPKVRDYIDKMIEYMPDNQTFLVMRAEAFSILYKR